MDICESGGNSPRAEASEMLEIEAVEDSKHCDAFSESRSDQTTPNASDDGESASIAENTRAEASSHVEHVALNGEESDGETEFQKHSLGRVEDYEVDGSDVDDGDESKCSQNISGCMYTSTPEKRTTTTTTDDDESRVKFPILEATDDISKNLSPPERDTSILDDTIEDAIEKRLDEDSKCYVAFESVDELAEASRNELKEVSVQTAGETVSCPQCKRQKDGVGSLRALCLEYPPYKKRKITDAEDDAKSTSDSDFFETDDVDGSVSKRATKTSSEDQVVPKCDFQGAASTDSRIGVRKSSSSRSIRVGLSKNAKPRPLHQKSKLQATDSAPSADH